MKKTLREYWGTRSLMYAYAKGPSLGFVLIESAFLHVRIHWMAGEKPVHDHSRPYLSIVLRGCLQEKLYSYAKGAEWQPSDRQLGPRTGACAASLNHTAPSIYWRRTEEPHSVRSDGVLTLLIGGSIIPAVLDTEKAEDRNPWPL